MASNGSDTLRPVGAFGNDSTILFQGDSITDGNRGRDTDPNHILGHGYAFIIAAKYGAAYPERRLNFANRGVSANTLLDLAVRWKVDTLDLQPDILSILIGINDAASYVGGKAGMLSPGDWSDRYDRLLADTLKVRPGVRFVLCEPFILRVGEVPEDWWKRLRPDVQARQDAVGRLAEKYQAAVVRCQQVFDDACRRAPADYWIWDSIHPTYRGHQLMADAWVDAVSRAWG